MNTEIVQKETVIPNVNLRHAFFSEIELKNGKKTQIITVFNNNDISFEEMEIGLNTSLSRQIKFYNNIKSVQHTFCSINKEGLNKIALYDKVGSEWYNDIFNSK